MRSKTGRDGCPIEWQGPRGQGEHRARKMAPLTDARAHAQLWPAARSRGARLVRGVLVYNMRIKLSTSGLGGSWQPALYVQPSARETRKEGSAFAKSRRSAAGRLVASMVQVARLPSGTSTAWSMRRPWMNPHCGPAPVREAAGARSRLTASAMSFPAVFMSVNGGSTYGMDRGLPPPAVGVGDEHRPAGMVALRPLESWADSAMSSSTSKATSGA